MKSYQMEKQLNKGQDRIYFSLFAAPQMLYLLLAELQEGARRKQSEDSESKPHFLCTCFNQLHSW